MDGDRSVPRKKAMAFIKVAPVALAALVSAAPAQAQNPWENSATIEQAVARAVADSMPVPAYPWTLEWSSFGVRGGRDVYWHLSAPRPYHRWPPPEGVHIRNGWLSVNGRSGQVEVCGDEVRIGRMSLTVPDLWLGDGDVLAELAARGVSAQLVAEQPAPTAEQLFGADEDAEPHYMSLISQHPGSQSWRLEAEEREPVTLSASWSCTPPGTRSGTRCGMTWSVLYRPDERVSGSDPCLPPRREGEDS